MSIRLRGGEGLYGGHVLKQQGLRAREGMGGGRGKVGMEVGRLGASVRREASRENATVVQL